MRESCWVVLTFESVDEILRYELNIQMKPLLNLSASAAYYLFFSILQSEIWKFRKFQLWPQFGSESVKDQEFSLQFFAYATLMSHNVYEVESSLTSCKAYCDKNVADHQADG